MGSEELLRSQREPFPRSNPVLKLDGLDFAQLTVYMEPHSGSIRGARDQGCHTSALNPVVLRPGNAGENLCFEVDATYFVRKKFVH
ncbi:hypothetical protein PPACK8108_LOCUS16815 [Phakopsora pachyrhizi]|uniref:Uncharacterized protein n=1 Tax=Phakopsora pachyrhizi TaxID=170000 RepID=A0AAV0BBZ6_PHAPC|nr:hypothetical protein PPACK8108_LOCUS16815 [Phakopsora pachyrhizi]